MVRPAETRFTGRWAALRAFGSLAALGTLATTACLSFAAGCSTPKPLDQSVLVDAGDGGDNLTSADGGEPSTEPLPPAKNPGDIVWQVDPGFAVEALALDPQGNVVLAGQARAAGLMAEIAIAKYTSTGAYLWHRSFGGPGEQRAKAGAVAADGTIVVTGGFAGQASFGEMVRTAAGALDVFVAAYTPEGRLKNVFTFGGPTEDEGEAVTVDPASGDWLVTGHGGAELMIDSARVSGPFVIRMQPSGTVRWARGAGRNLIAAPPTGGAVFVAGSHVRDQVTRHAPATGEVEWTAVIGQDIHPSAGVVDASGRLLLTGGFYTALASGTAAIPSTGKRDAFLLALDEKKGTPLWANVILASKGEDSGRAMCLGAGGHIYVAGRYFGPPDLGFGGPETSQHAFLGRHGADGARLWTRLYREGTSASSILCGAAGGIVAAGEGWLMMVLP